MQSLTLPEAKQIFFQLLADPRAQLGVVKLDARKWVEYYPYLAGAPFWAELIQAQERLTLAHENEAAPWRTALLKVNPTERAALLEGLLAKQVGRVLRLEARRIDRQMPLRQLGVDSLMSLEIRNLLELNLGMKLPAVVLLTHPTLEALGAHLLEKLALTGQVSPDTLPMAPVAGSAPAAENLNDMTEADLLTRLKNELALAKKGGKS
jgi:acyl carrier protein